MLAKCMLDTNILHVTLPLPHTAHRIAPGLILPQFIVLADSAGAGSMAPPASTMISARLKRVANTVQFVSYRRLHRAASVGSVLLGGGLCLMAIPGIRFGLHLVFFALHIVGFAFLAVMWILLYHCPRTYRHYEYTLSLRVGLKDGGDKTVILIYPHEPHRREQIQTP